MTVPNGEPGINPPDFGVTNDGTIPNLPARSQVVAENFYKALVQDSASWQASSPIFTQVVNALIGAVFDAIADAVGTIPIVGGALEDIIEGFADWLLATETTANTAQTTADSKSKVTKGTTTPTSPAVSDIWIDTTTGSNVYKVWNGSAWVVTTDKIAIDAANAASTAQSTADSKAKVTKASSAPSSPSTNDVWIDTTGGNNVYKVWSGSSWVTTTDKAAIDAANAAAAAQSTANSALAAVPSLSALSKAFQGDVDSTFDRILLPANNTLATNSDTHSHNITGSTANASAGGTHNHLAGTLDTASDAHSHNVTTGVPDYQPAGNGANLTELGYMKCSRDRTYTAFTFITGDSWTALGVTAFYLGVYSVNTSTGALTLVSQTSDIKASVTTTNKEYTFTLNTPISATKNNVYALGTLQVTSAIQTCNSLCRLEFWPISSSGSTFPTSLYAYAPGATTLQSSRTDASLTKNANFVPYYGLS